MRATCEGLGGAGGDWLGSWCARLPQSTLGLGHCCTSKTGPKGKAWTCRAILELWDFAHAMWDHRNAILHNVELEASWKIRDANINDEIKKLYDNIDSYAAEDRWYFEMPLALRLKKPLCSHR